MKSKIFENICDRSNIISAYSKMYCCESADNSLDSQEHLDELENSMGAPSDVEYPVFVYDDNHDDKWIGLEDFEFDNAKKSNDCEVGSDDYYFNLAFEQLGTDGVYQKLKENYNYVPSGAEIERNGSLNSESDLYDDIVKIGKSYNEEMHEDDIEVWIPDYAASYFVNGDDSSLDEREKREFDAWTKTFTDKGYTFVYDGETQEMKEPDIGEMGNYSMKGYFVKYGKAANESISKVNEHVYHAFTVTIRNIMWSTKNAEKAEDNDMELPSSDKISIEADSEDEKDIITEINNVYIDSYGFAPDGFDIVKCVYHGARDDGNRFVRKDDSVKTKTLKDLKKINPDIKQINEEGDDVDSEYDDNGIYHEFPKTSNKINRYRQKFQIHGDGSSKFDDLAEELHDALDGCTKGFFTDNQYSVVQEVMKRLQSIGLFTTITKIENTGIRPSDGLRSGKKYHFDATWTNKFGKKMMVHGIISIFFAGTVDDPESRYDACVHFFTDDGNYIRVDC